MERGQGILDLGRRGEHLDKEREGRKKEEHEHFKNYEKRKKEIIKKGLKGKEELKVTEDWKENALKDTFLLLSNEEEMEGKKELVWEHQAVKDRIEDKARKSIKRDKWKLTKIHN